MPSGLLDDIERPSFMKFLNMRSHNITIWPKFNRKAEFKAMERYYCVIDG